MVPGPVTIRDGQGHQLVKVCGDEQDDEEDANKEMDELRMLSAASKRKPLSTKKKLSPSGLRRSVKSSLQEHQKIDEIFDVTASIFHQDDHWKVKSLMTWNDTPHNTRRIM